MPELELDVQVQGIAIGYTQSYGILMVRLLSLNESKNTLQVMILQSITYKL